MGRPGQTGHGARLAHQASHRLATAFTGLSRHLLWGERCSAGHQGESHLADGLYFIHTMGEICLSPIGLSMVNKLTPIRFASLMMGIWYLSTATANKFAGTLSGLYPEAGKVKTLLGYRIETMYDFFMVFVVMSATASLILFLLSKKLQKMMHGVE